MPVKLRDFSKREILMYKFLSEKLIGVSGGVNAIAAVCDAAGEVLDYTPIRSNGAGGKIPDWVYDFKVDTEKRHGDAELKVLADMEALMQKISADQFFVYIYSTLGPCKLCRRSIGAFAKYWPHKGLQGTSVFYKQAGDNIFGGKNGYEDNEIETNKEKVFVKVY